MAILPDIVVMLKPGTHPKDGVSKQRADKF